MMCLEQNKQPIYYSLYNGVTEAVDTSGNYTGERTVSYTSPTLVYMNVSAAKGSADVQQFGVDVQYTKQIVTDDINCPIAEDSILWIDRTPTTGQTNNPHNYTVVRVAKSLNSIVYAVKEVKVSG